MYRASQCIFRAQYMHIIQSNYGSCCSRFADFRAGVAGATAAATGIAAAVLRWKLKKLAEERAIARHRAQNREVIVVLPLLRRIPRIQSPNPDGVNEHYSDHGTLLCKLECMLIAAFGSENEYAPGTKAIEKRATRPGGNFLPGVREDCEKVQMLFRRDPRKELVFLYTDFPGCLRPKSEYLEKIERLLKECKSPGVMIWYTGHGEKYTGDWCFKGGTLTFEELFNLYKTHFRNKLLYIVTDCCYAGQWVQRFAEKLDEMGILACGHQAEEAGIKLKVWASCLPHEKAEDVCFSRNGVLCNDDGWLSLLRKELRDGQTTTYMDSTRLQCLSGPGEPCQFPSLPSSLQWNWKGIVTQEQRNNIQKRLQTVTGVDKGRPAWHVAFIHDNLYDEFKEITASGTNTVDISRYGHIFYSGFGSDGPSKGIEENLKYWPW